jgi:hypothetical protein
MRNARRGSCASVRQDQSVNGVASDPEVGGSRSMPPRLAVSEQPLLSSCERIVILLFHFVLSGVFPVLCSGRISPGNPETRLSGFLYFREDALSQFCGGNGDATSYYLIASVFPSPKSSPRIGPLIQSKKATIWSSAPIRPQTQCSKRVPFVPRRSGTCRFVPPPKRPGAELQRCSAARHSWFSLMAPVCPGETAQAAHLAICD